jgi:hypothetical protein
MWRIQEERELECVLGVKTKDLVTIVCIQIMMGLIMYVVDILPLRRREWGLSIHVSQ